MKKTSGNFTNENIRGTYAFTETVGAYVSGGLGILISDGEGNLNGSKIINIPKTDGGRETIRGSLSGTYKVNSDGTGSAPLTLTLPDDSTIEGTIDFVITEVKKIKGDKLAVGLRGIEREGIDQGDLMGIFIVKRLGDSHDNDDDE